MKRKNGWKDSSPRVSPIFVSIRVTINFVFRKVVCFRQIIALLIFEKKCLYYINFREFYSPVWNVCFKDKNNIRRVIKLLIESFTYYSLKLKEKAN